MAINTTYRTDSAELMDDFSMDNDALITALDDLSKINRLLGGNAVTLNGVKKILKKIPKNKEITIADFGCGSGDMLRILAKYGAENDLKFNLIGIDANEATIRYARNSSSSFENIAFLSADILHGDFSKYDIDIAVMTLTLHHFKDEEIVTIIGKLFELVRAGIVVNDLHRNELAYRLFQLIIFVFRLDKMTGDDGLVSILRSFKKKDLKKYSTMLSLKKYSIKWKWAFRYQWLIYK